jgi:hypothetical protein
VREIEMSKIVYRIERKTIGGRHDSRGKWESDDDTYSSLKDAREQFKETVTEFADEPNYRFRLVKRTFTDEVIA